MSVTSSVNTVPFVDLNAQYAPLQAEIDAAMARVMRDKSFILGPDVTAFETAFAQYCEASYCVTVHTGTAALHLALLALGIGPGDEVITVSHSFVATAEAIAFCGATPRFVDIDPHTRHLDPNQLEAAYTSKVKAIIPVHLYGQPVDMDPILAFAKQYGIYVVEDACQAHGALYKGKRVGSLGDMGCFSFYPGKNLGAAGEGGAVVTQNANMAERIRLIRDHGAKQKYEHLVLGHNFRLDTLQAAILNVKLPHLDTWNQQRQLAANYYNQRLWGIPNLRVPGNSQQVPEGVYHLYVVEVANRAAVIQAFQQANIQFGIHYPKPIHLQPAFHTESFPHGSLPVTEALAESIISLPMFAEITPAQQDDVISVLKSVCSA